jgi:hypothetical protein
MTRINLISIRQQAASLGVAAVMTMAVLASLSTLANNGYRAEVMQAEASTLAVQQVVVVGKRQA